MTHALWCFRCWPWIESQSVGNVNVVRFLFGPCYCMKTQNAWANNIGAHAQTHNRGSPFTRVRVNAERTKYSPANGRLLSLQKAEKNQIKIDAWHSVRVNTSPQKCYEMPMYRFDGKKTENEVCRVWSGMRGALARSRVCVCLFALSSEANASCDGNVKIPRINRKCYNTHNVHGTHIYQHNSHAK